MKRYIGLIAVVCVQFGCSKSPQSYVDRGNQLVANGKYVEAELQYRKSIIADPKFAEGYYRLGVLEHSLRHGTEALDDLQRAVDFDRGNENYAIDLASISLEAYQLVPAKKNLYEQASQEAEILLSKDPNSFDGLRLHGDIMVIDRRYDEALADFRRASAIKPNNPDVTLAMAQVLFTQKRDRDAEELLQQFLSVRKDFAPSYDLLEAHYVAAKRLADAEHLLQLETASFPRSARPQLQLANLYRMSGRDREMAQILTKLVSDHSRFPAAHAQVGDFYAESRQWDAALSQYRAGLAHSSGSDKILYQKRIERALESLGKREEAIVEANRILKNNPKDAETRFNRALLLRESQDPKDRDVATEEFKSLADQYPGNAVVRYQLGRSYLSKGDAASAWKQLKKSADLQKDYIPPRLLLADIAQTAHNYSAAFSAANEVLAVDADNADAKLLRAAALVGDRSYQEAQKELDSLSKLQPGSKEVALEFADLAVGEKDYGKADKLYRRLYQPGSSDLRPLKGLLQVCVLERHPEKGQALLEAEVKQQPDSRPVRLLMASFATQQGKLDIAAQQYRWLQSKDPKSVRAYSGLGDLYQRQGETEEALVSYEKAEELAPKDPQVLNAVAVLESQNGQPQQAISTLNKQLALDPNNALAMNNLAFNLADTGTDLDRALSLAQRVARKFPNDPGVIDTVGWVYVKRGLNSSAIQVLGGLVKKYPNEPAFRYHFAVALLQGRQASDAKREFQAALSEHPPKDLSTKIQTSLAQVR
jgi:tetratricopeptide (TPR) repeat protein